MSDVQADTVVILSSELIAKITEGYFNKTMFKQPVEIVDLKPTEGGYMFSIAFVTKPKTGKVTDTSSYATAPFATPAESMMVNGVTYDIYDAAPGMQPVKRDSAGKFAKTTKGV